MNNEENTINAIIEDIRFFGGIFVTSVAARHIRRALHGRGLHVHVTKNNDYRMGVSKYPFRISL